MSGRIRVLHATICGLAMTVFGVPGKCAAAGVAGEALLRATVRAPGRQGTSVIVIDPGHPSERNDGMKVVNGISEVHACWLVAVRLKTLLEAGGMRVVVTKQSERQFVANRARAEIANWNQADLFLRLHCDSGRGSGFAVYYPDRQGHAFGRSGPDESVITGSRAEGARFHAALARALAARLRDNGLLGDSRTFVGSRQGALTGSIFSHVPVLTVEMCVLDNPKDAAFVRSEAGRETIAAALATAVWATVGR